VVAVLSSVRSDWLDESLGAQKVEELLARRSEEQAKRELRGVVRTSDRLIDYTHYHELLRILDRNWQHLAVALGKKKVMWALLDRFGDLRNTVAHGRQLLPFEADLLSGIAGEVRNRVAIYMSDLDDDSMYFPRIDYVSDDFGNEPQQYGSIGVTRRVQTGIILRAGDLLTITARGTDPHGRNLNWTLTTGGYATRTFEKEGVPSGDEVSFSIRISDADVAVHFYVEIWLAAAEGRYRRNGLHDDNYLFYYRVLPPASFDASGQENVTS